MKTANCEHFLQLQEKSLNLGNSKIRGKDIYQYVTKRAMITLIKKYITNTYLVLYFKRVIIEISY